MLLGRGHWCSARFRLECRGVEIKDEERFKELYRELQPWALYSHDAGGQESQVGETYVVGADIPPMFVTADTQHLWTRFVIFCERFSIGFALGLCRLFGLFLFLLFRRGGGILNERKGGIELGRRVSCAGHT
jgi:hypothetical protein